MNKLYSKGHKLKKSQTEGTSPRQDSVSVGLPLVLPANPRWRRQASLTPQPPLQKHDDAGLISDV